MSSPFVAEIRMFPFNFAPTGWAFCSGQILPISQNTALFSLLGTTYGGDGTSTFALPDMQGNVPLQPGQGPGLSLRDLGEMSGTEQVTLLITEIPQHTHLVNAVQGPGQTNDATNTIPSTGGWIVGSSFGVVQCYSATANQNMVNMNFTELSVTGGSLPHNNMQSYLTLNFCIALQGVFPPRP